MDGWPVALGGVRQRAVLVALLLRPNQVVAARELAQAVCDDPPSSAASNLRTYVAGLRRVLREDGGRLLTRPGGYELTLAPAELDLLRFHAEVTEAERLLLAGDFEEAARRSRQALALWRGDAFADIPRTPMLQIEAARLEEQRLIAVEKHAEAQLELGRHREVAAELRAAVLEHPLRERLWAHLVLALYRCGRQADALAAYGEVRRRLAEELGIEPGPELRALQDRILRADPALNDLEVIRPRTRVPSQLPPAVPDFTGRQQEVDRLYAGLVEQGDERDGAAVFTITGLAGVGKTALALHVAHLVRHAYPDGRLYLNLRGAQREPVEPATGLDRLLRALGVPGSAIPSAFEDRVGLYRTSLADRRVLVLLDNAADERQIRPFLPGTRASSVIVTSRARLATLEGAAVVPLDVLGPHDALRMLRRMVGDARVCDERMAAERIVSCCGGLPLAVRVAAARLVARPHWRLAQLAARLCDERRRMDELRVGDLDVRTSLALSYESLGDAHRRAFRLLSLIEAPHFPIWIAAALLGGALRQAEEIVETLVEARLVEVAGDDENGEPRFRLHDLLRAFGREQATGEDNSAALRRMLDTWVELAVRADARLPHQGLRVELDMPPGARPAAIPAHGDPVAWFEAEWSNLRAAVDQAAELGLDEHVSCLAAASAAFCDLQARFDDWERLHTIALDRLAARAADPPAARRHTAILRHQLGLLRSRQHRLAEAFDEFREATAIFEGLGDRDGAAYGWHGMGWMHEWRGRPAEALECHRRALAGFTETGNDYGLVEVLCSLGAIGRRAGEFETAAQHLERALVLSRRLGCQTSELATLLELGRLCHARRDLAQALGFFERSLNRAISMGDLDVVSNVRLFLAETQLQQGRPAAARQQVQRALPFFTGLRDQASQAWAWRLLSQVDRAEGEYGLALTHAERATALAAGIEMPQEQARAQRELAYTLWLNERPQEAARAAEAAIAGFDRAGFAVEADELRRTSASPWSAPAG